MPTTRLVAITSARPDGATSVAAALAAYFSAGARTLLIDLNLERPELAPLLDLPETQTVYHLAYGAQLAPVSGEELEQTVAWQEGLAVLPGIAQAHEAVEIKELFLGSLMEAAAQRFDHLVLDLGRTRSPLPAASRELSLLWVLSPTRLGLAAFERAWRQLRSEEASWLGSVRVVLNQVGPHSLHGVSRFLERDYGIEVIGELPYVPSFWQQVELTRTLQALKVEIADRETFSRTYGEEADQFRMALSELGQKLVESAVPLAPGGIK